MNPLAKPDVSGTLAKFRAVEIQAIALGQAREGRSREWVGKTPQWSPAGVKSGPVKAVAGRPVASIASRRATGGGEAYTARKQAVRIQLRHRFVIATPTPSAWRKAASRQPIMRGCFGVAGVSSPGHASKGTSREPRRAPYLSRTGQQGSAQPEWNQVPREARASPGKRTNPRRGVPATKGD